jgi:geranylgeranyl diphosphate synthase type I
MAQDLLMKDLIDYKQKADAELARFFDNLDNLLTSSVDDEKNKVLAALREFTLRGGKRIRPLLVMKGYETFTNSLDLDVYKEIFRVSLCFELMQSSFLIHDDIMDEADTRRNKPTVHKMIGVSHAILAGNVAMILAQNIILSSNLKESIKIRALARFNEIVETTNYGQALDLKSSEQSIADVGEEDITLIHILKTAKYTLEGPLQFGAILAGASDAELAQFSPIALPLGRAFQMQDDILGMFGDETKLGKSIFSDVIENKKTLLVSYAFNNSCEKEQQFIVSVLGNKNITSKQFKALQNIIIKSGALEHSKKQIKELAADAVANINSSKLPKQTKEFLLKLADYLVKRDF